jgi:hypothetical protein
MLAARVAVVVDSAALVAQVLVEAQLPVPARRPAAAVLRSLAALQADRLLPAPTWLPRVPLLAALLVAVVLRAVLRAVRLVGVVPAEAVPLQLLLSRQSFSAAMARSTTSPAPPPYDPAPRSR